MPGLKWILHGNEYWYAEAEGGRVRKEHGRKTPKTPGPGNRPFCEVKGRSLQKAAATRT
jgi:hypothetical protein